MSGYSVQRSVHACFHLYLQEDWVIIFVAAVVADDRIFIHKMEGVDVDDIVQFNRVLLAGTPNDTLVGRPFVQSVHVIAAVEEQVRDATTYIYKRKRASGYRRFRGFRAVTSLVPQSYIPVVEFAHCR